MSKQAYCKDMKKFTTQYKNEFCFVNRLRGLHF